MSSILLFLVVKHGKSEVFHFSRSYRTFNSLLLDLMPLGGPILHLKNTWCYLGFFFDWKLSFHQHIDFYANKAILTVKYMKMLSNSIRGLNPLQKRCLYRSCALSIVLYSFQSWYYNKAAALWITDTFCILPSMGVKAITGLVSINLQLKKLNQRYYLQE